MPERGNDINNRLKAKPKDMLISHEIVTGRRGLVLKLLACVTYYLSLLPVISLIFLLVSGSINYIVITAMLISAIAGWAAFNFLARIKPWIKIVLAFVMIAGIVYFVSDRDNLITNAATGAVSYFLWMICFIACKKPALSTFNSRSAMMPVISAAIVQVIVLYIKNDYPEAGVLQSLTGWIGGIWGIIAIIIINRITLHSAAAEGHEFKAPKTLLPGNTILTAMIICIVAILSFLDEVKAALKYIIRFIVNLAVLIMTWIGSLFAASGAEQPPQMEPEILPETNTQSVLSELWNYIIKILVIAACAALAVYLLYIAIKNIIKLIKRIIRYINELKAESAVYSYTDEEESAFDLDRIRNGISMGLKDLASWFKRKQRLEDMPDNRRKIRYLYRMMLEAFIMGKTAVPESMTPDELCGSRFNDENASTFFESYNKARYSLEDVTDSEVTNARNVVGKV